MARKTSTQRLTRKEWLARALDALARYGDGVLTVDKLASRLGVSRGSFYWHFEDKTDFARQLVDYWSTTYTENVVETLGGFEGNAEEQLLALMNVIILERLARYDLPVRAWAAHDAVAAGSVRKVDQFRMEYVGSLFSEMGFEADEAELRTRAFVVYFSLEGGLFVGQSKRKQSEQLKRLHTFFTRR